MGADIDRGVVSQVDLNEQMKITADILSDALLTAKFVQGIPIVGAVGGIVNYNILNRISSYARLKYKKILKKNMRRKHLIAAADPQCFLRSSH